jgi:hypothetical protein
LEERAHAGGFTSLGAFVEHLILDDAATALELFPLFRENVPLDEIVSQTQLSPGTVKSVYREFVDGLTAGLATTLPRVERARQRRHDEKVRLKTIEVEDRSTGRLQRIAATAMRAASNERIASEKGYTARQRALMSYLNSSPIDANGADVVSEEPLPLRHAEPSTGPSEAAPAKKQA